ncbi:MAG: hypothetical protein GQ549_05875 [Gammaproteobacteria bacterium]|nr:hypothetical protein [Gammaproteobacteria bacterium]
MLNFIFRIMKRYLLSLFLLFVFSSVHAADDRAFFWQVNSDTATVYLMGSIHFADKSFYPLRKEIEHAFSRSDALVVELDISKVDSEVYNRLLSQRGIYNDGTTIKDVVSDETWLQLRQRLQYLNIPYDSIKSYKPGILVLTLSAVQVMKMGFDPELGIDAYFLSKAAVQHQFDQAESVTAESEQSKSEQGRPKQIIELETLEQQINLFLNIPDGELLLKESLYSLDEAELLMADMVRYWKKGDEALMNKLLFEDALTEYPASSDIYDDLFYQRNQQMVSKIDAMLSGRLPYSPQASPQAKSGQQKSYFVVVGSGHMIGEKGIVQALKEKGYEVERL